MSESEDMRIMVTHQNHIHNTNGLEYDLICIQSKHEMFQDEVFVNVVDEGNGYGYIEISTPTIDSMLKPVRPSVCSGMSKEWRQVKRYRHTLPCEVPAGEIYEEKHVSCEDVKYFYFEYE